MQIVFTPYLNYTILICAAQRINQLRYKENTPIMGDSQKLMPHYIFGVSLTYQTMNLCLLYATQPKIIKY